MMSTGMDAMVVTSPLIILAMKCSRMLSLKYPMCENDMSQTTSYQGTTIAFFKLIYCFTLMFDLVLIFYLLTYFK